MEKHCHEEGMKHQTLIGYTELLRLRSAMLGVHSPPARSYPAFTGMDLYGQANSEVLGIAPAQCSSQMLAGKPIIGHRKIGRKLEGLTKVLSFDNNRRNSNSHFEQSPSAMCHKSAQASTSAEFSAIRK